jgi:hypothetical protein
MSSWPWPPSSATGIGSLPGEDISEAVKLVLGDLPNLPFLPELPDRGPGADMIGRGAGFLVGLPVELYSGQWRVASHPGLDLRRTHDLMNRDLDAVTEAAAGYSGPLKVQAPGPWTLAANLDLPVGGRLLQDHGAVRDLAASLTDGLRAHVADVARRVPGASVLLQLDEPSVPAVIAGQVPTESGLRTLRSVAASTVESTLRDLVTGVEVPVVVPAAPPVPRCACSATPRRRGGRRSVPGGLHPPRRRTNSASCSTPGSALRRRGAHHRYPASRAVGRRRRHHRPLAATGLPALTGPPRRSWSPRPVGWPAPPARPRRPGGVCGGRPPPRGVTVLEV